ncbi:MAG: transporter substrate-binding domain-containing protein [Prochlorococcaceae cyanobacterium]
MRGRGLAVLLLLTLPLSAEAATVLRVGVLDGSPPCSIQQASGKWQGRAVDLWEVIARREQIPYVLSGYPNPRSLLEAAGSARIDVGVGCLTVAPERVGRYRFSLPFQEEGLALLLPTDRLAGGRMLLQSVFHPQLLRVMAGYLLMIALISWLVWRYEHRGEAQETRREQLRRYALVFQVLASGPGTNVIVTRTRGHALVLLSWLVRIIGASLIVSTITLEVLRQPPASGFQPRSLTDLAGRRIAVRPGSVSAQLLLQPPLLGTVNEVPLPNLAGAPELLLKGHADAVLADEQQLRFVLDHAPLAQRSRLRLALQGTNRESQAFVLSPGLEPSLVLRIDRAISQAKRDGLVR